MVTTEENKIKQSYQVLKKALDAYYLEFDIEKSLKLIKDALKISRKAIFAYQLQSDILKNSNKIDDALEILEQGLKIDSSNYFLLWRRSEILGFYKNRTPEALADIQNAINFFEQSSENQEKQLSNLGIIDKSQFLKNYTSNKIDLKGIQQLLLQLNQVSLVHSRVNEIENQLTKRLDKNEDYLKQERFRNIELLGIFTAVLGFIFANVQKSAVIANYKELLLFDLAISIPLMLFIIMIKLMFNK